MKYKKYKILGSSFKQYIPLSKNTFTETKENKITEQNIKELIKSFKERKIETFVYLGHKDTEEREAIGKVIKLENDNNSIGLYATIEWFDNSIIDKESFYPSIEMVGKKVREDNEYIYWENCEIKAIACVEYPASRNVDLLCASAIINNLIDNKEYFMLEVKNILEDIVKNDSEDSKEKLIELFRKDKELQKSVIDFLIEKLKQEETNKENQENKREDANTLTETTYNEWCNEYAESKNAIRCSSKSECSTYIKAKKLYKAGLSKDEIISIVKEELVPIGVNTNNENTNLNLSALKDDDKYIEIAKLFK